MGVPALFRWLSKKYPKIISPVIEETPQSFTDENGNVHTIPIDIREPNPNGEEVDNLYCDFNGVVHNCTHPEGRPAPANEAEMMLAIFEYTDKLISIVRPRKVLMIAVDGVAPRAKMNQQRQRRFRSAQEAAAKDKAMAEYHDMLRASGRSSDVPNEGEIQKTWDSNAITPSTPFMDLLAASLRYWVSYKLSTDPGWAKLKVIISDASVPGEGEHKIMDFVRSQRNSEGYDPNTTHVMYGLDADLIFLSAISHEVHFRIFREDVFADDTKPGHCRLCGKAGHMADRCREANKPKDDAEKSPKKFIWLDVAVLREYLAIEMSVPSDDRWDLERSIDDWVFMCFFVGNDFLPHLPALSVREDGIDVLIAIWRDNFSTMGGYLTEDGTVNFARVQTIFRGLAQQEDAIYKRRHENDVRQEAKQRRREEQNNRYNKRARYSSEATGRDESVIQRGPRGGVRKTEDIAPDIESMTWFAPGDAQTKNDPRYLTHADIVGNGSTVEKANADNRSAAAALKDKLMGKDTTTPPSALGKRMRDEMQDSTSNDHSPARSTSSDFGNRGTSGALGGNSTQVNTTPEDTVMLWEEGYQDRYYEQKFHVSADDKEFRRKVARRYAVGLAWVLAYYSKGCAAWGFFYEYHYAPFAADFVDIADLKIDFELGEPSKPFEQLMSVMPAASKHTLPEAFHPLMTEQDSPIIDYYPEDFAIDMNGEKAAWKGVVLLPFIDSQRLLDAMAPRYPLLSQDEQRRNTFGHDALLFSTKHPLFASVNENFFGKKASKTSMKLKSSASEGLFGKVDKDEDFLAGSSLELPFDAAQGEFKPLDENGAISVHYHMPAAKSYLSALKPGVNFPTPMLDYNDVASARSRAQNSGRSFGGVKFTNEGRSDGQTINYRQNGNNGNRAYNDRAPQSHHGQPPQAWQGAPAAYAAPQGYGYSNGYNQGGQHQYGYGAPPPPPVGYPPAQRGGYGGYNNQGYGRHNDQGYGHHNGNVQGRGQHQSYNGSSYGGQYQSNNGYNNGRGGRRY